MASAMYEAAEVPADWREVGQQVLPTGFDWHEVGKKGASLLPGDGEGEGLELKLPCLKGFGGGRKHIFVSKLEIESQDAICAHTG